MREDSRRVRLRFVDVFPSLYEGTGGPAVLDVRIRRPTAEYDHPGEEEPVIRLAFDIMP